MPESYFIAWDCDTRGAMTPRQDRIAFAATIWFCCEIADACNNGLLMPETRMFAKVGQLSADAECFPDTVVECR